MYRDRACISNFENFSNLEIHLSFKQKYTCVHVYIYGITIGRTSTMRFTTRCDRVRGQVEDEIKM